MRRRVRVDAGLCARVRALLAARDEGRRPGVRPSIEVRAQADGATELLIYDEIGFWGINASDFAGVMAKVSGPLHVRVNSPGGDVFDGIAIYNMLADYPGEVTVIVDGLAASAASFIAQAGDRVRMNRGSQMMIHDASGLCIGNAAEMQAMAALLDQVSDALADIYAARSGTDAGAWREAMRAETWYTAEQAVEAGLADEMVPHPEREDDEDDRDDEGGGGPDDIAARRTAHAAALYPYRPAAVRPQGTAVGPHETATKEGTWDAGVEEKRLPSPVPVAVARRMYGWYDASKVEDGAVPKSACKLPHHFVSSGGEPGAASLNGVRNALARLPQTEGLSDAERATIERHLRSHLPEDADDQVPAPGDQAPAAAPPAASPPADSRPEPAPHPGPEGAGLADEWAAAVARLIPPADTWESLREALL